VHGGRGWWRGCAGHGQGGTRGGGAGRPARATTREARGGTTEGARGAAREARGGGGQGGTRGRGEEEEEEGERERGGELTTGIQIRRSVSPKPRAPRERERGGREGLSDEPTTPAANGRLRDQRATRGQANGHLVAPDCPVCQGDQRPNGRLHQKRKEIRHRTSTVHVWWCTGLSGAPPDRRRGLLSKRNSNGF
jgi:hypothetical protein